MDGITEVNEETLQVGLEHSLKEIKFRMSSTKVPTTRKMAATWSLLSNVLLIDHIWV